MRSRSLCTDQIEAGDAGCYMLGVGSEAGEEIRIHVVEVFFLNFYTSKVRRHDRLSKDTKQGLVSRLFLLVFFGFLY